MCDYIYVVFVLHCHCPFTACIAKRERCEALLSMDILGLLVVKLLSNCEMFST